MYIYIYIYNIHMYIHTHRSAFAHAVILCAFARTRIADGEAATPRCTSAQDRSS